MRVSLLLLRSFTFLLLQLLTFLLNFAGFSIVADFPDSCGLAAVDIHNVPIVPAAAVFSDDTSVPAVVGLPACCCWLHYFCKYPCLCLRLFCVRGPVVAFISAIACISAVVSSHASVAVAFCWRHLYCLHPCFCWHSCCCWQPLVPDVLYVAFLLLLVFLLLLLSLMLLAFWMLLASLLVLSSLLILASLVADVFTYRYQRWAVR
jgi:hypothetical protein